MSINDAMKALAESLEPNPDSPGGSFEYPNVSPLGWWRRSYLYDAVEKWSKYGPWEPVDPRRSEDASARLLDAMPPLLMAKCQLRSPGEAIQWDVQVGGNHELSDDRKTAIFLAALAWKGIERPEGL